MAARWFNVDTGQFDTRDTVSNSPVPDSVNANRYQYGDANPLTVTDPTGHWGFKSLAKKATSVASSAFNRVSSYASSVYSSASSAAGSAYRYASSQASRAYKSAKTTVKKAVHKVKKTVHKAKKAAYKAYKQVKKKVKKAVKAGKKWVSQKVAKAKQVAKKAVKNVKQAGKKIQAKAARVVKKTVTVVKDAAAASKKWVVEHKDVLLEVAAIGGAILAGLACTAVTAGVGAVACMVGAGALINLAKDSAQGDVSSFGDALGSMGTGAVSGLVGGAGGLVAARIGVAVASKVGAGVGGRLATEAAENGAEEIFGQAVTTGRVDVRAAALGVVPGLSLLSRRGKGGGVSSAGGGGPPPGSGASVSTVGAGGAGGTSRASGVDCKDDKHSFDPGTPVLMADGSQRPIEDVNVGDEVVATDPRTDESAAKEVTALHRNVDREFTDLTVVDEAGVESVVKTTQNHPFWNASEKKWTEAADLEPGDELKVEGEGAVVVKAVRNHVSAGEMRDLTVADTHTYYVLAGKTPVLVHNTNCVSGAPRSADGKFANRNGEPGRDGAADEVTAWEHLELDGAIVSRGETGVSVPGVGVRKYDGTVQIDGQWYGIETKGGSAKRSPSQRTFDNWLNTPGNSVGTKDGRTLVGVFDVWIDR
jgi:hypothetical protein